MTYLWLLVFVFLSSPVFAQDVRDGCSQLPTMEAQMMCVQHEFSAQRAWQAEQAQLNRQAQVEAARMQAMGMAAFGSGHALIGGMNQGLGRIQVQPYQLPMPPSHR